MSPKKIAAARFLLWLGAFAPIIYTVGKTMDDVGGGGVGWLDAVRGGGGFACYALALMAAPRAVRKLRFGPPEAGVLLFTAVGFLSVAWSVSPQTTFLKMIPMVGTLICVARLSAMYDSPEAALRSVIKVAHVVLAGTLVQLIVSPSTTFSGSLADPVPRLHSSLPAISSNIFGVVIAIGLAGVILKFGPAWTLKQPMNFLLFATYFCMLLATRSRMITVVAILIAAVLLWKVMHSSPAKAAIGWLTIGCLIGIFWLLTATKDPSLAAVEDFMARGQEGGSGLATLTGRTVIWGRALPIWQARPWTGYGYYSGHRLGLPQLDGLFAGYSNLDNTWIESLVDVGILGAAGLFIFAVFALLRICRNKGWGQGKPVAVLIAIGIFAMSFVNPTIQANTSTLIFFAALAFASRPERIPRIVPADLPRAGRRPMTLAERRVLERQERIGSRNA